MEFKVTNVNVALQEVLRSLHHDRRYYETRNGPVIAFPEPVLITYSDPEERVLFSPRRNANPWFHFMEALWMMAGRNDVHWMQTYTRALEKFSDDGHIFNGAYGFRWRHHFGIDQMQLIANGLREDPTNRRLVMAMWDAHHKVMPNISLLRPSDFEGDLVYALTKGTKDVPCNTHIYFDGRHGQLDMTVCNRSNDIWFGAFGSNAVHFSTLLEVMAAWAGMPVGVYRQFSNNLHLYTGGKPYKIPELEDPNGLMYLSDDIGKCNYYVTSGKHVTPFPIMNTKNRPSEVAWWFEDLDQFMSNALTLYSWKTDFFKKVAVPMAQAWHERQNKINSGLERCKEITARDWRQACTDWIIRREHRLHPATDV